MTNSVSMSADLDPGPEKTAAEEQLNIDEAEITDQQQTHAGIFRAQSAGTDEPDDTQRKTDRKQHVNHRIPCASTSMRRPVPSDTLAWPPWSQLD
jgi:hypothetical protein